MQLSAAMQAFVSLSSEFSVQSDVIEAEREAYLRMARVFTPERSARSVEIDHKTGSGRSLRFYRPKCTMPDPGWPTVFYLHGGGWMVGNLDSHAFVCRALSLALNAQVVALDYRLAPEHPYPAALADVLEGWQFLVTHASVDNRSLIVAGDSAGGNLAAALCLALRDKAQTMPCGQALIYPLLGAGETVSRRVHAKAPLLSATEVTRCIDAYLPCGQHNQPLALPLSASDLAALPPSFVTVAQYDPLHDDGVIYADRLLKAGCDVELYEAEGWLHGGLRAMSSEETQAVMTSLQRWIQRRWNI